MSTTSVAGTTEADGDATVRTLQSVMRKLYCIRSKTIVPRHRTYVTAPVHNIVVIIVIDRTGSG